jgi:3-oxoacyl-[acyl-carrier protein] reductase
MKRVLVTGASSGIGLEVARAFLERGVDVVAQYRRQAKPVDALVAEFGAKRVAGVEANLGDEQGCVALVQAAGDIDVLVHSAGIWNSGALDQLDRLRLEEMYRVNTFSAYYLAREAARIMKRGNFVFIGSTAGQRGEPGHSHYAGSKAALWGIVQSLAQELGPRIRVNLVSPGWVRTPMAEPALAENGREERICASLPLERIAEPEDVAAAVIFVADDRTARHLSGIDIPVSGGALLPLPRG